MDIKKSLKDVVVLVAICVVFATVLAAVNSITAPIIAEQLAGAANQAYEAVMPDAAGFEDVDLSAYSLPATVKEAKRETSGKGFAIKLETKGYGTGMVLIVGVATDGTVTGATCVTSTETNGDEKTYGGNFAGKDKDGVLSVELIAGSTLTTSAYRGAVVDAINAATILGGGNADIRDEAQILSDNLNAALGLEGAEFTKVFMIEVVDGVQNVYSENSGKGYVALVDGKYVGVDADGNAVKVIDAETNEVTEGVDELKTTATAAVAIVAATELTDLDISEFVNSSDRNIKKIFRSITSISKTSSGTYVVVANVTGYASDMIIKTAIGADGVIINTTCVSSNETNGAEKTYGENFIGKSEEQANGVDTVSGSTMTTDAYKRAIANSFSAIAIIESSVEGGAANE